MVADAFIYHPAITQYNKFAAQTVGRDKAFRLVQYLARFIAWHLSQSGSPSSTAAQLNRLKANLGMVRRALRLGKFIEHLRAAASAYDARPTASSDAVMRFFTIGRQLGYASFLFADNLTYLDAAGIRPSSLAKKWTEQAQKAWTLALGFSVANSLYVLFGRGADAGSQGPAGDGEKSVEVKKLQR